MLEKIVSTQIVKYLESDNLGLLFTNKFGLRNDHTKCKPVMKFIQYCLDGKEIRKLF